MFFSKKPSAVAFVDYEYWLIAMKNLYKTAPDVNRSRESRQKNTKSLRSEALLQSKLDGAFVMQLAGRSEMVEVVDSVSKDILNGICAGREIFGA